MITIKCERCGVENHYESLPARSNDADCLDKFQVLDLDAVPIPRMHTLCGPCRDEWIQRQVRANHEGQVARKKYMDDNPFFGPEKKASDVQT